MFALETNIGRPEIDIYTANFLKLYNIEELSLHFTNSYLACENLYVCLFGFTSLSTLWVSYVKAVSFKG